ncbi:dTDP-4-dehydrorhamnose reductase [Rubrobacter taiwanensis]|uniref:dTDP-4-dehydrorhamnose reductase n=1 Tax=Rubrobacter taiwanensis TaxID=185139 RepID=A0A4V6NB56_9ACTN|nr:dTDP-4-dehydrorhamnose reductase [Rubrobacter taiwanensis]TCJ20692.1 dTDP-4-dehydrorhamnose reductase [Rubrobacter taiwanensis]
MKVLVTGAGGQLGLELMELMPARGYKVIGLTREELDISDAEAVEGSLRKHRPGLVINAAAYTNVDSCEEETGLAYRVNTLGPRNLAQYGERLGCELLHVSTNYVFDGSSSRPYEPFDLPNPISAYGRTKLAGEEYVKCLSSRFYIVRTAGVYGMGRNFVRTMLRLAGERDTLKVKDDEFISPTYARDLAGGMIRVIESGMYGIYHITNAGFCSWYEFAREIFKLSGREVEVLPVPASEYPLPAARPANGVLSSLGSPELRHWREGLADYLERIGAASAGP